MNALPVVKEQFLSGLYSALGKDADAVISVNHHHLRVAVGVDGVVREPDLVALTSRIHNEIWVQNYI